jgi:hypothetical protein
VDFSNSKVSLASGGEQRAFTCEQREIKSPFRFDCRKGLFDGKKDAEIIVC